jgi:hypothetical protein
MLLRAKLKFPNDLKLIWPVQIVPQKYSASQPPEISSFLALSRLTEGRLAIVTNAGRDAVDAAGAQRRSAPEADGEVVWS